MQLEGILSFSLSLYLECVRKKIDSTEVEETVQRSNKKNFVSHHQLGMPACEKEGLLIDRFQCFRRFEEIQVKIKNENLE